MLPFIKSAYFNDLLESFSNGVIIFNVAGRAYAVNEAACEILGMPRQRLMEEALVVVGATLGLKRSFHEALRLIEERPDDHTGASARYTRPDGTVRNLNFHRSQLEDHGKVFGIILEITDVTPIYEFHAREKNILEQKREAERLRAQSLQRFSSAVAHQIRNPLLVIGGFASRLLKGNTLQDRQREWVGAIEESGHRLEGIVNAVSEYSSVKVGERTECPLSQLAEQARATAAALLPRQAEEATWDLPEAGPTLLVDRQLFCRALGELFRNSLEAAGNEPAEIAVSFRRSRHGLLISVTDQGPGFREEDLPFVFDPFYSTKPVAVGMGLCLAEHIIREHGGRVSVGNGKHRGARLDITLPEGEKALPAEDTP